MGKGDSRRPGDAQKYRENWERAFQRPFGDIRVERKKEPIDEFLDDLDSMGRDDDDQWRTHDR